MFPDQRPRRLRRTGALRDLVAETALGPAHLIAPLFVAEGRDQPRAIESLPGHFQHTLDSLRAEVEAVAAAGIGGVILFGLPTTKDDLGSAAWDPAGVVQVALAALRRDVGDAIVLSADLCLDEYTTHGHCGVLDARGEVDNDATLELYARVALAQAEAGAHVIAPSGMMDGQVGAVRRALDGAGHHEVAILAYSAKYASPLYGPFREAVAVQIADGGDRRGYQQDFRNRREALLEARADVDQGADMVMVKPAGAYLDVIAELRAALDVPVAAYQVSGEYAMIKAAAERGWLDGRAVAIEQLTAIRRAGADAILTYFARELAAELAR